MIVPYSHVISLTGILFLMGMFCAVTRRNLIMVLLGLEIMLNAVAIAFVGAALRWQHLEGQAVAIFILAIAAAEVSIGLALIVCAYKRLGSVDPEAYN
ncbi:MAG: NADH-quinone oxidoreductase subunit NuoK [Desulfobacterales bacterium]|nr:MAG: NADH-quinone oxidoreductase subunit NuoK [Desulfobacterales bacterium]